MADKPQFEVFQSPVGELVFPWINTPDTRFDKAGVFHLKLALPFDLPETQQFIAQLEKVREDYAATLEPHKRAKYKARDVYELQYTRPAKDASEEEKAAFVPEPTGNVEFKAKLSFKVTPKEGEPFEQRVEIVDKNEDPLEANVWSGSLGQIKGQIVPYVVAAQNMYGVTLRLRAVKIHELVTGQGSSWAKFS